MAVVHYHKELSPVDTLTQAAPPSIARRHWPQIYFGVASTSLATLLLELALTRVFSVVYYYHFAFLAISIALFGLGAGGVFSYVVSGWKGSLYSRLGLLATLNAVAIVLCLSFLLNRTGEMTTPELTAAYFVAAIPFLLSGTIISLAIGETIERVDKVYFFDLAGAAGGCAVLVPLLNWVGGPNTILVAAVLFAVSAAVWFHLGHAPRGRVAAVLLGLVLVGLITYNWKFPLIDVKFAKGLPVKNEEFVQWNSFSRIALKPEPGSAMKSIVIDADAATGVADFDFNHLSPQQRFNLAYAGPGFPYLLRPGAKTLIIGPGGGWDVSRALASGSKDITAVEINPIIANVIMRDRFPQYSNYLYFRPEVHLFIEDGRSFVRRSHDRYQVLQATLVDTWASTAAGAFALSENNLYTTNAFKDYLSHLTPDGVMAFTRWGFDPPRESLRVVSLAYAALKQLGQSDPALNVAVVRQDAQKLHAWGSQDTILISRDPFTAADLSKLRESAQTAKMQVIYAPGTDVQTPFRQLLLSKNPDHFYDTYPFDVRPVSDNKPFFFYTVQAADTWRFMRNASRATEDYKINSALPVLFGLVAVSIIATLIILALPPLVLRHSLPRDARQYSHAAFFSLHRSGLHFDPSRVDSEICAFSGAPDLRAYGDHLLYASFQRMRELRKPSIGARRHGKADPCTRDYRGCDFCSGNGRHACFRERRRAFIPSQGAHLGRSHSSCRVRDGHALSHRFEAD